MRGKRARALQGRLPSGTGRKLYGYDYLPGKGIGEGVRYENKEESRWVNEMYRWLVEEGLTINGITRRLRGLGVSTPAGSPVWRRQSVYRMLTNPAYTGKTFSFKVKVKIDNFLPERCVCLRQDVNTAVSQPRVPGQHQPGSGF